MIRFLVVVGVLALLGLRGACVVPEHPGAPRAPSERAVYREPATDLTGLVTDADGRRYELFASPRRDRFRVEGDGWAVIGPLRTRDWALFVDTQEGTHFRFSERRLRDLRRVGGASVESRYRAAIPPEVARALAAAQAPFASPCDQAERELQRHGGCRVQELSDGTLRWRHRAVTRGGLYQGFEKRVHETEHDVDPRFGLLVASATETDSGSRRRTHLSRLAEATLAPERFEPPAGSRERLSDDEILETTRAALGWSGLVEGHELYQRDAYASDEVARATTFGVLREAWMQGRGSDAVVVEIASARPTGPFDFDAVPLDVAWELAVPRWDDVAAVGERSTRLDETTILFVAHDTLVRVEVFPDALASELPAIAARLAERAGR